MRAAGIMLLCLLSAMVFGYEESYEIPDETEYVSRTCRLSVKLEVIPDKTMEKPTGRAVVTANLFDDDGNPYRGERIEFSATHGTFICRLPEDAVAEESETSTDCFSTRDDGIAKLYLVNIPLNTKIQVKATYNCGDRIISSTASLAISRGKAKRRKQVKPHP
ncbi:MAG: hypothetical protein JW863_05305 [Chitinispirillaceae bacterium]|nr:hypothetical protein [Chitinispirillaceae bacterium]